MKMLSGIAVIFVFFILTNGQPDTQIKKLVMKNFGKLNSRFGVQFLFDPVYLITLIHNLEKAYWSPFRFLVKQLLKFYEMPNRRQLNEKKFKIFQSLMSLNLQTKQKEKR